MKVFLLLFVSFRFVSSFVVDNLKPIKRDVTSIKSNRDFDEFDDKIRRESSSASEKYNREIDIAARNKAKGGTGEMAAGAILGGLVLGPFGALFGAQLGANVGAKNAVENAKKEEMKRLGITSEMLQMAEEAGSALQRSIDGMKAIKDSLETQQRFAKRLENDANDKYEKAKVELENNNEEKAKQLLMERQQIQNKLKKTLLSCVDERKRLEQMESNIDALEERAMEIERLLQRSVGAKAMTDMSDVNLSLSSEDPLLEKFRNMGID